MNTPELPEHQSIFGDTYHGVPNPNVPHASVYPNRFHGPNYRYPRFYNNIIKSPYQKALQRSPISGLGDSAPLFQSTTGNSWVDALLGAAAGFIIADKDKVRWAAIGAATSGLAGTIGLVGAVSVLIYKNSK